MINLTIVDCGTLMRGSLRAPFVFSEKTNCGLRSAARDRPFAPASASGTRSVTGGRRNRRRPPDRPAWNSGTRAGFTGLPAEFPLFLNL